MTTVSEKWRAWFNGLCCVGEGEEGCSEDGLATCVSSLYLPPSHPAG